MIPRCLPWWLSVAKACWRIRCTGVRRGPATPGLLFFGLRAQGAQRPATLLIGRCFTLSIPSSSGAAAANTPFRLGNGLAAVAKAGWDVLYTGLWVTFARSGLHLTREASLAKLGARLREGELLGLGSSGLVLPHPLPLPLRLLGSPPGRS